MVDVTVIVVACNALHVVMAGVAGCKAEPRRLLVQYYIVCHTGHNIILWGTLGTAPR